MRLLESPNAPNVDGRTITTAQKRGRETIPAEEEEKAKFQRRIFVQTVMFPKLNS